MTAVLPERETWRPAVGWEGAYEVSNHGRVRSLSRTIVHNDGRRRTIAGGIRRPQRKASGHHFVQLSRYDKAYNATVHRLVIEAFVGPAPDGAEVCHNNGDPADNRLENLRWDTHVENMRDLVRHGGHHAANKTHCKHGHEFTPENTYLRPGGKGRDCEKCRARRRVTWAERNNR